VRLSASTLCKRNSARRQPGRSPNAKNDDLGHCF
jgi:hypothetical protein